MAIAPELVQRPLRGHRRRVHALADQLDVFGDRERRPVVEDDHRELLGGGVDAPRHGRRRRRADDVRLADEPDDVGHVATAAALDVIGVDGPAVDRGDRVLELGALVQPVRVERDAHVVPVRVAQRVVDELRVGAVVLVDLEAARAGLQERVERGVLLRPGARLQPDVERPVGDGRERPRHGPRRLLEARGDERRDAARQRRGQQLRRDQVDVAVDRARRRDEAIAHDRLGVRADAQLDPVD